MTIDLQPSLCDISQLMVRAGRLPISRAYRQSSIYCACRGVVSVISADTTGQ
jgi:hypothetical protein